MHARALARFLACAGHPVAPRPQGRTTLMDHADRTITTLMAAAWKDFLALHMTWGAVHECATIQSYRRLMQQNDHPVLDELATWVSGYLFDGEQGRIAAQKVDREISTLPGFEDAALLGNWLQRKVYH